MAHYVLLDCIPICVKGGRFTSQSWVTSLPQEGCDSEVITSPYVFELNWHNDCMNKDEWSQCNWYYIHLCSPRSVNLEVTSLDIQYYIKG